jgi:hypothetical protein
VATQLPTEKRTDRTLADIRRNALRSLIPPPRIALSDREQLRLPEGVSALPCGGPCGRIKSKLPTRSLIPTLSA